MKSDGALRHFLLAFVLAVVGYALFYHSIEHRRTRKGPWLVTFTNNATGVPMVLIDQPRLAITNVQISFLDEPQPPTNTAISMRFDQARDVPFAVPFGSCIFMDTTFLPGTVTFQLFSHEIELLPRALIIDHQEHPWMPEAAFTLHPLPAPQPSKSTNAPPSEGKSETTLQR